MQRPCVLSGHTTIALSLQSGEKIPPERLKNIKVFGFCALGNPGSFRNTVAETGALITGFTTFRDHYSFAEKDMIKIKKRPLNPGQMIVTTEKDMIKIRDLDCLEILL